MEIGEISKESHQRMVRISSKIIEVVKEETAYFITDSVDPKDGCDIIFNAHMRALAINLVALEDNFGIGSDVWKEATSKGIKYWVGQARLQLASTHGIQASEESSSSSSQGQQP